MKNTCPNGFTLIELSIVLVIIGLVVGGILVGRDLIRAAEIRAQITQIERLSAAGNAFKIKYNCIAGDCANATDFNLGPNGNGNGEVNVMWSFGGPPSQNIDGPEPQNFWVHMSAANLIEGTFVAGSVPGVNSPALKFKGIGPAGSYNNAGGGMWVTSSNMYTRGGKGRNHVWLTGNVSISPALGIYLASDLFIIDTKMDDGKPLTGTMRQGQLCIAYTLPLGNGSCPSGCCVPDCCTFPSNFPLCWTAQEEYDVKNTLVDTSHLCTPIIQTAF